QLQAPGPDEAALARILAAAVRVPDHGKRVPWRFIRIAGAARAALGEALVARPPERDPDAPQAALDKDRNRFPAPLGFAAGAGLRPEDHSPEQARCASACRVSFAELMAAQAEACGAQWPAGWPAADEAVQGLLGHGEGERIAGFIHIGTPRLEGHERERP